MSEAPTIYCRPARGPAARAWMAVGLWTLAIGVLSLLPVGGTGWIEVPLGLDKWMHAIFYGVLSFLGAVAWRATGAGPGVAGVRAVAQAVAYGGLVEWLQSMFARDPSLADWVADLVGATIGVAAWWLARERRRPMEDR